LPDEGRCRVAGYDVARQQREVRRSLGVSIRGERSVYWKLTGRQNLEYFAGLYGLRGEAAVRRIDEVAEVVGLTERIDDYVERYSMGMKQRLAIGVSLAHRPPVLRLDEPTIGLDPNGARALRSLLKDLCRRDGVTILYTTHYLFEAEELSDRLAIIDHGRKVLEGSPDEVRASLGDNRIVEVQLAAGEDGALAALRACALVEDVISERRQPTVTTVRLRTREPLGSVTDLAGIDGLAGARVLSVALVRPTLEDVFVTLTGTPIMQTQEVGTDDAS
jgi:ABC-2 type transport system ATP-binding protein